MQTALYYPHSSVRNTEIVKNALLLWDKLEYIRPDWYRSYWEPAKNKAEEEARKLLDKAMDLIGHGREPTESEKERAHEEIKSLIDSGLPDWFIFNPENPYSTYQIFPDKLLPKTWQMLEDADLAMQDPNPVPGYNFYDWAMNKSLGLTIMLILARVCAGTMKSLITDESDAYATWTRCFTKANEGQYGNIPLADDVAPETKLLVTISLDTISTKPMSLKSIYELRKREMEGKDTVLPTLREKYFTELNKYLQQFKGCRNETDWLEIQRQFKKAMQRDLALLKRELKVEARKTLWSKEMATGLIFVAGTFFAPYITATIGIGALGSAIVPATGLLSAVTLDSVRLDYRERKRTVLEKHPMSWLYMARPSLLY